MSGLPEEITVGHVTYRLRRFTPKRKGEKVGHDWIREVAEGTAVPHRSAVGAEAHMLLDEIARLRAIEYDAEMAELPQVGER